MSLHSEGNSVHLGFGHLIGTPVPSVTVADIARRDAQDERSEPRKTDDEDAD